MSRLAIIGCGASKLEGTHRARDLYTGPLFRSAVADVEARGLRWLVLSARYGLVEPDREIESYDETMAERKRRSGCDGHPSHRACSRGWCYRCGFVAGVDIRLALAGDVAEVHAGAAYVDVLLATRAVIEGRVRLLEPLRGLEIGHRLQWYARRRSSAPGEQLTFPGVAA